MCQASRIAPYTGSASLMSTSDFDLAIADRIEGLKQPYEHGAFMGQVLAEKTFLEAAHSGRLHHAWLLSGPRGVGKATFAFRVARYFADAPAQISALNAAAFDAAASPHHPAFRHIAKGVHPNILHLRVPYDEKAKKFKTQLTVDEVRRSVGFFGTAASDRGWRIAIVDSANDMNANAANALLKILEEPPARTLFFLLSDQPGRLLPTIKSRCQNLSFHPLNPDELAAALKNASSGEAVDLEILHRHHALIGGSVRRAFQFAAQDASGLLDDFNTLIGQKPSYDMAMLHRFADQISMRGAEEKYAFFIEFLENYLISNVRVRAGTMPLVSWAEVWDKVHGRIEEEKTLNLDRKQTVLALFHDLRI